MAILDGVVTIASGSAKVFELHRGIRLTLIPGSGATVTFSRVDDPDATAHIAGVSTSVTVVIDADWPYYRVSTSGGSVRVAMI